MIDMIWAQLRFRRFSFTLKFTLWLVYASQHMKTITYHMVELYFITLVDLSFNSQCLLQDNPSTLHQESKYCKLDLLSALRMFHLSIHKLFTMCLYRDYGSFVMQTIHTLWADSDVFQPQQFLGRNTLTEIHGVPLGVIKCDLTWGKAFRVDLVGFYAEVNYYLCSIFCFFFFLLEMMVISLQPQLQYIEQVL